MLRARLLELQHRPPDSSHLAIKIRTYYYPENRVTDHRIGLTLHTPDHVLEGHLDPLLDAFRD